VNHVICANCGTATEGEQTGCTRCGVSLRLLEPMVVECGWCDASNHRDLVDHCGRCGGPLPALPGGNPGAPPPAVPRALPRGYRWRVLLWKNVLAAIGAVFTTIFCWSVIFPIIGIPMWYFGHRKGKRWLLALEHGRATGGRLTQVAKDYSQKSNGESPWRIEYTYERHDGTEDSGFCEAWDPAHVRRKAGDAVWVVYGEDDGALISAIWPPLH